MARPNERKDAVTPELSVLDLIPVHGEQTSGDALRASREIIRTAEQCGYTRYWVAEHHNMPSVASTTPSIELMYLGEGTERIRLGSGGVMLPNHAPLAIAEQFALLTSVYGDRIDLGIGRAPGTDPVTSAAMRGHLGGGRLVNRDGETVDPVEQFPQHVMDVIELLTPEGVEVPLAGGDPKILHSTPVLSAAPQVWLLGSSDYSAQLAAALGLPYVFAHHFSGHGTQPALQLYRDNYRPTRYGTTPQDFVSVNVVIADTQEEAEELAEPFLLRMANIRTGRRLLKTPYVGEVAAEVDPIQRSVMERIRPNWIIADAEEGARQVTELAERFSVGEIMVHPVAGQRREDDPHTAPARVRTLELLAEALKPATA